MVWRLVITVLAMVAAVAGLPGAASGQGVPPGAWSQIGSPPGPDGRSWHNVVAAPELGLVIVFGGYTERGPDSDAHWLDLDHPEAGWKTLPAGGPRPAPRFEASAVWDPVGHRMLVFGGYKDGNTFQDILTTAQPFDDLWALTFDPEGRTSPTWSRLHDGTGSSILAPAPRGAAAMVYDSTARRLILHGGTSTLQTFVGLAGDFAEAFTGRRTVTQGMTDMWAYDLAESGGWSRLSPGLPGDPALYQHQAAYDAERDDLVVTGGHPISDVWNRDAYRFDLGTSTWARMTPEGDPPGLADATYGYSSSLDALLVTGGFPDWETEVDNSRVYALRLDGSGAWEALPDGGSAHPTMWGVRGAVAGDRFALFGGLYSSGTNGYDNDATLSLYDVTPGRWATVLADVDALAANAGAASAIDTERRHLYVLGGARWDRVVWDLDLVSGTWRQIRAPGSVPEGGLGMTATFDTRRDRLVVMGAGDRRLWSLDVTDPSARWRNLRPLGDAPALAHGTLLYDPVRDRLLAVGGYHSAPGYDWGWFGSWQQPSLSSTVFALDLAGPAPVWHEVPTSGPAPKLVQGAAVYDPRRDAILTLGGARPTGDPFSPLQASNAVHQLRMSDGVWRTLAPTGEAPSPRTRFVAGLDLAGDRLIVWGGDLAGDTVAALRRSVPGLSTDGVVHVLDLASEAWGVLRTTGESIPRVGATGAYDPLGRQLVTFGGYGSRSDESIVGSRDVMSLSLGDGSLPPDPPSTPAWSPPDPSASVRGGVWAPLGPAGAHGLSVAIAPDGSILAGTLHSAGQGKTEPRAGGLYLSRDAGSTWRAAGGAIRGASVTRIAISPSDPARVYAAAIGSGAEHAPMYVSRDGGATWERADDGLPSVAHYALALDAADPDRAWAGGKAGGLYGTTDGGETWARMDRDLAGQEVFGLASVPLVEGGTRLLAATRSIGARVTGRGRVFLSDDGGVTWSRTLGTNDLTFSFSVDPSDPRRVLLAAGDGIWRSEDAGSSWSHVSRDAIHAAWLAFDPTSSGAVAYAGGVGYDPDFDGLAGGEIPPFTPGLFRSDDGGSTWTNLGVTLDDEDVGGVAVSDDGGTVVAAGLSSGVFLSRDAGITWARSIDGMTQHAVQGLAADAEDPNHLVTTAHYDGVMVSEDGGATWTRSATPDAALSVVASPTAPGLLLAAGWQAVWKSSDGGRTWTEAWQEGGGSTTASYLQPGSLALHPTDPQTWWIVRSGGEVAVTHDAGASYTNHPFGTDDDGLMCVIPIAVNPAQADTLLAGDTCGGGIFRSADGGVTWSASSAGLTGENVTALEFAPGGVAFAGTLHQGVFRSDDGGRTWVPSRTGLGYRYVKNLLVDPADPLRVFAAVDGDGVYESDDGGRTWSAVLGGLTSAAAIDLDAAADGDIYVTTDGGGVHRLDP